MKTYQGYLIDLDGTCFRGNQLIKGALDFVYRLEEKGIPYLYLTNNSTRSPELVAEKLKSFGFPAHAEQVYSSAIATAEYLKENVGSPTVYVIGEEGLIRAIQMAGLTITDHHPDVVVVGLDRQFSYEKMKIACLAIQKGAKFIGTNRDRSLPTEEGNLPGSGSLAMAIASATGVDPLFIGKPEPIIMRYALKKLGISAQEVLVVGDNLETDILAGKKADMDSMLVFTGVTTPEMLKKSTIQPTYAINDLKEWTI